MTLNSEMSDMTLWCLLKGKDSTFRVVTSPTIFIDELKKLIENKIQTHIPSYELKLWKVNVDLDGILGDIHCGKYEFDTNGQQPLPEIAKLSSVWQRPWPSDSDDHPQLHVYITLPADVGRPTLSDTTARLVDYAWLREFHSKLWGRKDLEGNLFRKVKITEEHFTSLQERLKLQHPDRDSPEYNGSAHNVLSVKLGVLQVASSLDNNEDASEMDVDSPEASNEDDSGPKWSFPITFRFLDLTSLSLKKVPPRLPSPLFLRREYDDISALIWAKPETRSVVVSGQPGTGKTSYLHLRVIQFIIEGRQFLYQSIDGIVYHVDKEGVHVNVLPPDEDIVAFVDADKRAFEPSDKFRAGQVRCIITSSPKVDSINYWMKQATRKAVTIATNLWSSEELLIAGMFLHPLDISFNLLKKSTSYFGFNPRLCFDSALSAQSLKDTVGDTLSIIKNVPFDSTNIVRPEISSRTGDSAVSHSIFAISPKNNLRRLTECATQLVSPWAFDVFMAEYKSRENHKAMANFRQMSRTPEAASLWGHVFERLALDYLDDIGDRGCDFQIRQLAPDPPEPITPWYLGHTRRYKFLEGEEFIHEISEANDNEWLHLVPSASNFTAVDSILYNPNDGITCVQATVSSHHPINADGLRTIQRWFPTKSQEPESPLADLRPSQTSPWRFIFIVPPQNVSGFTLQPWIEDTGLGEWAGKVHQYVLGLDVLKENLNNV